MKPPPKILPRAVVPSLVVLVALCLTGCGQGAGDTTTTLPGEVGTAPTATLLETTSSTNPPETTTSAPPSETSTSTSEVPSSSTTTDTLVSAETLLPNGRIRAMGYIRQIGDMNQRNYIWISYAELLTGDAATAAAIEAGFIGPGEQLDTDYFIANKDPKRRQFEVSESVVITTSSFEGVANRQVTWDEFRSYWSSSPPPGAAYLRDAAWWIEREGKVVVTIEEQYLP